MDPLTIGLIAGSGGLAAGGSIWSGIVQKNAAKDAANAQMDAAFQARNVLQTSQSDALNYLDPFRQFGLNAGYSIQDLLYSPEQRLNQIEDQRMQLQAEVERLQAAVPKWEGWQDGVFTGKNASERKAAAFGEQQSAALAKLKEAQTKLATFDKQAEVYKQRAASGGPKVQESPWYQFQAELLGRNMDRFFAARGLTGSGFEAEERRRGLIELGAGETERQFSRMAGLYNTGANAASQGANVLTGMGSQIANTQIAEGNAKAQGILREGEATAGMISGVANAVTGSVGSGLNYSMFQNLINRNSPQPQNRSYSQELDFKVA